MVLNCIHPGALLFDVDQERVLISLGSDWIDGLSFKRVRRSISFRRATLLFSLCWFLFDNTHLVQSAPTSPMVICVQRCVLTALGDRWEERGWGLALNVTVELFLSFGQPIEIKIIPHCLLDELSILFVIIIGLIEIFPAYGGIRFQDSLHQPHVLWVNGHCLTLFESNGKGANRGHVRSYHACMDDAPIANGFLSRQMKNGSMTYLADLDIKKFFCQVLVKLWDAVGLLFLVKLARLELGLQDWSLHHQTALV